MGRCRVVGVETDRKPLSDGDWVVLKRQLNVGEHRQILKAAAAAHVGGGPALDYPTHRFFTVLMFIAAWSFTDPAGEPLPITVGGLESIDLASYKELRELVDAHEAAAAEKKTTPTTAPTSDPISGSPFAAAGASSGSERLQ